MYDDVKEKFHNKRFNSISDYLIEYFGEKNIKLFSFFCIKNSLLASACFVFKASNLLFKLSS